MFEKSNLLLALATGSRGYTDKTHLRGFKTLNFSLVRAGKEKSERRLPRTRAIEVKIRKLDAVVCRSAKKRSKSKFD